MCSTEQYVYVAMAGQHQIWRYDTVAKVAGEQQQRGAAGSSTSTQGSRRGAH